MKQNVKYEEYKCYYSETKMWDKVMKVAKKAGIKVIYLVLLLFYVLQSPNVSATDKAKIYAALGYFIFPIDLIPDAIPVAGYTDDMAALLWALRSVWANVTPEITSRAKTKLHEWFGKFDERDLDNLW